MGWEFRGGLGVKFFGLYKFPQNLSRHINVLLLNKEKENGVPDLES